jgi:hypothetical protein
MKTILSLLFVFSVLASAQEIIVLTPNKSFTAKDTTIIMTLPRFNRIDSVVSLYKRQIADYQKDSVVYAKGMTLSDSIQHKLIAVQQKNDLIVARDSLYMGVDSLLRENIKTYQGVIKDLQNTVTKENKSSANGFFNDTFWFGTGAVVGVVVMYVSAQVLKSIK